MDIPKVEKQKFDFNSEENKIALEEWKTAVAEIPFPKESLFNIDSEGLFDEEELAVQAFSVLYEFLEVDPDTWFWIVFVFDKDGTAYSFTNVSYSTLRERELVAPVNKVITQMGFSKIDSINQLSSNISQDGLTWQGAYDKLCDIARKLQLPKFKK